MLSNVSSKVTLRLQEARSIIQQAVSIMQETKLFKACINEQPVHSKWSKLSCVDRMKDTKHCIKKV